MIDGAVLSPLLARRMLYVTGKGGVGKSLFSAAAASAMAADGLRTLWVEMSETPKGGYLFDGYEPGYAPQRVEGGLWAMNLRFQPALEEYLDIVFKLPFVARMIARNQLFRVFTTALPGLDALVTTGKLWYEAERTWEGRPWWDRIVVDAPATGHGLALLKFPHAALDIVRSGPIADRARDIDAMLGNREHTAIVVVATLEELPVDEAGDLVAGIRQDTGYEVAALVANMAYPDPGAADPDRFAAWLAGKAPAIDKMIGPAAAGLRAHARWLRGWREQQAGLRPRLDALGPTIEVPWLVHPDEASLVRELAGAFADAVAEVRA